MALDDLSISIRVMLDQLRSQMRTAEGIVGGSVNRMNRVTGAAGAAGGAAGGGMLGGLAMGGVLGGHRGFGRIGRGLVGIAGVSAGLSGIHGVAALLKRDFDEAREAWLDFSNTLSLGLAGKAQRLIDFIRGTDKEIQKQIESVKKWTEANERLWRAMDIRRGLQRDLSVLEAETPSQRVMARLAASTAESQERRLELSRQGVPESQINRIVDLEARIAAIEAVRSEFGPVPASKVVDVLQRIEANTRGAPK